MRPVLRLLAALLLPAAEAHAQTPVIFPVTVAVTFDRKDIHPVLVEGTADLRSGRPVAASDPVRIASISKLVTA